MSWESLEEITDRSKEFEKANEIASMYYQCFNTDAGKYVLQNLAERFLTKPIVRPNEDIASMGIREGRADIVRQILNQIEYAKSPMAPKDGVLEFIKGDLHGRCNPRDTGTTNKRNKRTTTGDNS
jgi:hypothetical protein